MARSIIIEDEDGEAEIWTKEQAADATVREVATYITDKIEDYSKRGLKGPNLYEY